MYSLLVFIQEIKSISSYMFSAVDNADLVPSFC